MSEPKMTREEYQKSLQNSNHEKKTEKTFDQNVTPEAPQAENQLSKEELREQKIKKTKFRLNMGILVCVAVTIVTILILFFIGPGK